MGEIMEEAAKDDAPPVLTFAVEVQDKNTTEHPDHESTQVCPTLVRRADSEELLPRPFTSTSQLVCTAYLSMLCCCFCAAFAVKRAWSVKLKRTQGLYTSATRDAQRSCYLMLAALCGGSILWMAAIVYTIVMYR